MTARLAKMDVRIDESPISDTRVAACGSMVFGKTERNNYLWVNVSRWQFPEKTKFG